MILTFDSNASSKLDQMFGIPKYLIVSPQGRQQNLSLEIDPMDNVVLHFPHENLDGSLSFDECLRCMLPVVCHKLVSIW